jgi:hypothetical protein
MSFKSSLPFYSNSPLFINNNENSLDYDDENSSSSSSSERLISVKFADQLSKNKYIIIPISENILKILSERSNYLQNILGGKFEFPSEIDFQVIGLTYELFVKIVEYFQHGTIPEIKNCVDNDYYTNIYSYLGLEELIIGSSNKQTDLYLLSPLDTQIRNDEINLRNIRLQNEYTDMRNEDRNFILRDELAVGKPVEIEKRRCDWFKITGRFREHEFDDRFEGDNKKYNLCQLHIKKLYQNYSFDKIVEMLLGYNLGSCAAEKDSSSTNVCIENNNETEFQDGLLSDNYKLNKSNGYWCLGVPHPRDLQVSNFKSKFSDKLMNDFDFGKNLILAGGSVNSIILKQEVNDYDVFCITKDYNQAIYEIKRLHQYLLTKTTYKIVMIRNQHAITFRSKDIKVQFILRLYNSIIQVISGFDIDSCCVAYDGIHVYGMPRYVRSVIYGYNFTDPDRQSLTYSSRLIKYQKRRFAIALPGYNADRVNLRMMAKQFLTNRSYILFNNIYERKKKFRLNKIKSDQKPEEELEEYIVVVEPLNDQTITPNDSLILLGNFYDLSGKDSLAIAEYYSSDNLRIFNYDYAKGQKKLIKKGTLALTQPPSALPTTLLPQSSYPPGFSIPYSQFSYPSLPVPQIPYSYSQVPYLLPISMEYPTGMIPLSYPDSNNKHNYIIDVHNLNSYIISPFEYKECEAFDEKYLISIKIPSSDENYGYDPLSNIKLTFKNLTQYVIQKDKYVNYQITLKIDDPDYKPEDFLSLWRPIQDRIVMLSKYKYTGLARLFQIYMKWMLIPRRLEFSYNKNKKDSSDEDDIEKYMSDYASFDFNQNFTGFLGSLINSMKSRFIKKSPSNEVRNYLDRLEISMGNDNLYDSHKKIIYYVSNEQPTFIFRSRYYKLIHEYPNDKYSEEGIYINDIRYDSIQSAIRDNYKYKDKREYDNFIKNLTISENMSLTLDMVISDNIDYILNIDPSRNPFSKSSSSKDETRSSQDHEEEEEDAGEDDHDDVEANYINRIKELTKMLGSFNYQYTLPLQIQFITENPGNQFSGSFHPVYDEWYQELYCLPTL